MLRRSLSDTEIADVFTPEMYDEETVLLPKEVSKLVTQEWNKSQYRAVLTRAQYIAKLVEAAAGHEANLREEKDRSHNLVQPATHIPAGAERYIGRR